MTSKPFFQDDAVTVFHGDNLSVLAQMEDCSIDSVVTDPPYGIGFMGHQWDQPGEFGPVGSGPGVPKTSFGGDPHPAMEAGRYDFSSTANRRFQAWCEAWARECFRVLKPGGYIVSFGGSRTWHRLQAGIEDAGFEIRDSIAWLYGSGFPKSLDVSKAVDAHILTGGSHSRSIRQMNEERPGAGRLGTAMPINGVMADAHAEPRESRDEPATPEGARWSGWGTALKPSFEPIVVGRKPLTGTVAANILEHGVGGLNIAACRVEHASEADRAESEKKNRHRDFGSGPRQNRVYNTDDSDRGAGGNYEAADGRWPTNVLLDESQADELDGQTGVTTSRAGKPRAGAAGDGWGMTAGGREHNDVGGASRFFPTFHYEPKASSSERPTVNDVSHPTVKPLALMRWLVRLVTPGGGLVLDLFGGSGTTAEACIIEGLRCIIIEREADYLPLIVQRVDKDIQPVLCVDGEAS